MAPDIDWPPQFERTPISERTRNRNYDVSLSKAFYDLETTLDRLGVDDYDYEFDARQRKRDKRPYARASPDDPSFVLRWTMDGAQYAVACDRFSRLRDNVRTVGLYVEEKRKMEGRPVATGEAEFANARLPPGDQIDDVVEAPSGSKQGPHEVLEVTPKASSETVKAVARRKLANAHPDNGGDSREYKRILKAREAMLDGTD